jgi:hypothetical protein
VAGMIPCASVGWRSLCFVVAAAHCVCTPVRGKACLWSGARACGVVKAWMMSGTFCCTALRLRCAALLCWLACLCWCKLMRWISPRPRHGTLGTR